MEEKSGKTVKTSISVETEVEDGRWVSPEVVAAQAGDQVEMGKDLSANNSNNDTDA